MTGPISIAIETSSRAGAVALGVGDEIIQTLPLGASGKHASELLAQLDVMLTAAGFAPADIDEVYVSVGPGSFTGLRVGITVARTLGQLIDGAKLVAVPTPLVIAENFSSDSTEPWENLCVLLAAKRTGTAGTLIGTAGVSIGTAGTSIGTAGASVHATLIRRGDDGNPVIVETIVAPLSNVLEKFPAPILFTGEALEYVELEPAEGITITEVDTFYPRPEGVWNVGRRLAAANKFTPYNQLLPVYSRIPEAIRLSETHPLRRG